MSSITAQLTKLDLELVPKENRLDIKKCNGRIPSGLTPRELTFQVVLDAIALNPCYPTFLITADVPERTFAALINRGLSGKTSGLDKLRLSRAQILWESTQMYEAILPKCLTSPTMKESKAYKTYLGNATGVVPPKIDRKFKKPSPSKKDNDLVPLDEEPITKSKRVKRSVKKSSTKPATGVVIREAPVETKSKIKEKENMDVTRRKGIELLSETHPSGSGTIAEKPQSVDKITPTVTSDGTGDKPGVLDVTEDDSTESSKLENESDEQEEEYEDDDQEEKEFIHTPTDDKDDDNLESESDDVIKSD
ncbi:hypothetical protein Tco_1432926, partial [Tanacetum coccineum]